MIDLYYTDDAGATERIQLLSLSHEHGLTATPTDHPVEDGSDVTDHVKLELETFSSLCHLSNALISPLASQMGGAVDGSSSVQTPFGSVLVQGLSERIDRVQLVYEALRTLRASKKLVTIVTPLRRYESMIITSLSFPVDNKDGVEFQLDAREVRVAISTSANVPQPAQTRGNRRANAGTQPTQPNPLPTVATPTVTSSAADNRSSAAQLMDSLF